MISKAKHTDIQSIKELIKTYDSEFTPTLSERVDINDYVDKIFRLGEIYKYHDEDEIKGIMMIYMNDHVNLASFLSLILVTKKFRNTSANIGKSLIHKWIKLAQDRNFKLLEFEVASNKKGLINWYESFGFNTYETSKRNNFECNVMKMELK